MATKQMLEAVAEIPLDFPYEMMNDNVLCKRISEDKRGSIVLPSTAQSDKAVVVAVGEGRIIGNTLVPINLHPGQEVLITGFGKDVTIDGVDYVIVRSAEVDMRKRVDD